MPMGRGKYDDVCTLVREQVGIADGAPGSGVVVIIFGGNSGSGFSVQADALVTMKLPDILELVAGEIRASLRP